MGQYRVFVRVCPQLGFLIRYDHKYYISIDIPFVTVVVGLTSTANGFNIFGFEF